MFNANIKESVSFLYIWDLHVQMEYWNKRYVAHYTFSIEIYRNFYNILIVPAIRISSKRSMLI